MENTNVYQKNSQRAYESDIFNTKGLNNDPELFAHKRKRLSPMGESLL